jgi:arylsulfatase A-like enzyme/Flp pilus assembly protein TadD
MTQHKGHQGHKGHKGLALQDFSFVSFVSFVSNHGKGLMLVLILACAACRAATVPAQAPAPGALRGWNVLLVTIDTLRADHVGAYGSTAGATPTLDRLAREGARFAEAYAHVPLTLPSHAALMTGAYPFHNGVRDNGTFRLDASKATMAKALKATGYRTGAFVGAFVLDARFGLNAGFDVYDDRMTGSGTALEVVQRPAEQVLAPAADWILGGGAPRTPNAATAPRTPTPEPSNSTQHPEPRSLRPDVWFAWVHLYDPHEPYEPPEPFRSRYASDAYTGEVAYTDAAFGQFLDRLRASGALARTLVIVTSDHGESLGEHGERTHGLFAYNATLRVPLIVWATEGFEPVVVSARARLVDMLPTVGDLLGIDAPDSDGRSLRAALDGRTTLPDSPSYFEALNANFTRGWAPLRGVILGTTKLVDLPIPELYDLAADAKESRNIYPAERERARPLEAALDRFGAANAAAAPAPMDPDAEARLRSLGYVVGTTAKPSARYTAADDPKRLVHLNAALDDAMAKWSQGDAAQAIATLRQVIAERPDLTVAYDRLAFMLRATGRAPDGVKLLDEAARAGHADAGLLRSLGTLLRDTGNLARSASVLEALVQKDPNDLQSADALGQTYARMSRMGDAERLFRHVLGGSPNAATTWNNLGTLYLAANRNREAVDALSRAVAIDPALAGAHNGLGVAYARQGEVQRAVNEWQEALKLRPDFEDARANLR